MKKLLDAYVLIHLFPMKRITYPEEYSKQNVHIIHEFISKMISIFFSILTTFLKYYIYIYIYI
jgi:hypothetical protein